MTVDGIQIDKGKLLSKDEALDLLFEYGEDYRAMAHLGKYYRSNFGNELVWRYPISDGLHLGTHILIVKEGFLSVPYESINRDDGELLELNAAATFDADDIQFFINDWRSFSDDLLRAMSDMLRILSGE